MKIKSKAMTVIAAMMCLVTVFSCKVSANSGAATSAPTELPLEEILDLSVNDNTESKNPLTPKGNLTSVDDVRQVTDATDKSTVEDKQFITVQSKNGNTFYIIIDRSGDTDNVYFLNAVDESDLFALMEEEEKAEFTAVCTCTEKCELGAVDEGCAVCSKDVTKCAGEEPVPDKEETEEPEKSKSGSPLPGILILVLLGGGGAFYWFVIRKKKPSTKGPTDPSEYEEDEDDDDDEETEVERDEEIEDETNEEDFEEEMSDEEEEEI